MSQIRLSLASSSACDPLAKCISEGLVFSTVRGTLWTDYDWRNWGNAADLTLGTYATCSRSATRPPAARVTAVDAIRAARAEFDVGER